MTVVLETNGLGKQYGRKWALHNCTLSIPSGKVVGLVGPNGAGKTTLLQLAVALLVPTTGTITVLGGHPGHGSAQLERVGFVAQDTPTYASLSVAKHLRMGAYLNANWDQELAERRVEQIGLDSGQKGDHSPAASVPSSHSPGDRSGPSSSSSMSRWPDWTRSPDASSSRALWRTSPSTGSALSSPPISSPTWNECATISSSSSRPTCSSPET